MSKMTALKSPGKPKQVATMFSPILYRENSFRGFFILERGITLNFPSPNHSTSAYIVNIFPQRLKLPATIFNYKRLIANRKLRQRLLINLRRVF